MSYPAPVSPDLDRRPPADDIVVLRGATWADHQRLLEIRGERSVPRLTYLEGVLEIMTPSRPHESITSIRWNAASCCRGSISTSRSDFSTSDP